MKENSVPLVFVVIMFPLTDLIIVTKRELVRF